jgi:hypothetical protein
MSISRLTNRYLATQPAVRECLARGIINHSALARDICIAFEVDEFDAALAATRRYAERLKRQRSEESKVHSLLKRTKLRIRNSMTVIITRGPGLSQDIHKLQKKILEERGEFSVIQGEDAVTIVTNDEYAAVVRQLCGRDLVKISSRLVQVTLLFDKRIETTPGVLAYIFGLLADAKVNILEEMSCWTDVMLMISEDDLTKTLEALDLTPKRA